MPSLPSPLARSPCAGSLSDGGAEFGRPSEGEEARREGGPSLEEPVPAADGDQALLGTVSLERREAARRPLPLLLAPESEPEAADTILRCYRAAGGAVSQTLGAGLAACDELLGDPWQGYEDLAREDLEEWFSGYPQAGCRSDVEESPLHEQLFAAAREALGSPVAGLGRVEAPAGAKLAPPLSPWRERERACASASSLSSCSTIATTTLSSACPSGALSIASAFSSTRPTSEGFLAPPAEEQEEGDRLPVNNWEMEFALRGLLEEMGRDADEEDATLRASFLAQIMQNRGAH